MKTLFTEWKESTEERYDEMLGAVPPAYYAHDGFLLGEPIDDRHCEVTGKAQPTYLAFVTKQGAYYESVRAITIDEFQQCSNVGEQR